MKIQKKILVLSSSARKGGNTDLLCDEFIRGAKEANHTVEKMYVGFLDIKGCLGCRVCQGNGGQCVQRDDMDAVYKQMLAADIIVFATPVYFYSFNAQMKAVMDRTFAIEQTISGKESYLITTGAAPEKQYMKHICEHFELYISCFKGIENKGVLIGCGTTDKGDIKGSPAMKEAYNMGKEI